jgi:hypothetical protein
MDVVKKALTRTLPAYLSARPLYAVARRASALADARTPQALPLPDEVSGFATLTQTQWAQLAPALAALLTIIYLTSLLLPSAPPKAAPACVCARALRARRCGCWGVKAQAAPLFALRTHAHNVVFAGWVGRVTFARVCAACACCPPAQAREHAREAGVRKGASRAAAAPRRRDAAATRRTGDADSRALLALALLARHAQCVDTCNSVADIEDSGKKARAPAWREQLQVGMPSQR